MITWTNFLLILAAAAVLYYAIVVLLDLLKSPKAPKLATNTEEFSIEQLQNTPETINELKVDHEVIAHKKKEN